MKLPKYFYFRVRVKVNHHGTEIEVEDASNEDVAEIVRCRDCKHFRGDGIECYWGLNAYEDDFCSHGERERDEGKRV